MKIENLVRITAGILLNNPAVNSIEDIKTNPQKITRGNLFIDINASLEDIKLAISNGAYAIISKVRSLFLDDEIAWIYVEDIELAIIKLSRYYTTKKDLHFIQLSQLHYSLLKCLRLSIKAQTLPQEPKEALKQILHVKESTTFFTIDSSYVDKIDPTSYKAQEKIEPTNLISKGAFISSFVYKNLFVNELRLSSFFVPHLLGLLDYLDSLEIEYSLDNFSNFGHFYPQFVDKSLNKKEFGMSERALIFEYDSKLFEEELIFLEKSGYLESTILFIPNNIKIESKFKKIIYNTPTDLAGLKNFDFRYALVFGNKEDFEYNFNTHIDKQMKLF